MALTPQRNDDRTAGVFATWFPARSDAMCFARHDFEVWLRDTCVDDDAQSELGVVFSELAANAVDASPKPSAEVIARAWHDGEDVVLEIVNASGRASPPSNDWDLDDPLRPGGRGLVIVEAFVDELEVANEAGGRLRVRCRRHLARS
jgi:anti-sigma regulatory factor (Ser/Thr protein kinase)